MSGSGERYIVGVVKAMLTNMMVLASVVVNTI